MNYCHVLLTSGEIFSVKEASVFFSIDGSPFECSFSSSDSTSGSVQAVLLWRASWFISKSGWSSSERFENLESDVKSNIYSGAFSVLRGTVNIMLPKITKINSTLLLSETKTKIYQINSKR